MSLEKLAHAQMHRRMPYFEDTINLYAQCPTLNNQYSVERELELIKRCLPIYVYNYYDHMYQGIYEANKEDVTW